jgi:hypothetical protein
MKCRLYFHVNFANLKFIIIFIFQLNILSSKNFNTLKQVPFEELISKIYFIIPREHHYAVKIHRIAILFNFLPLIL